MNPPGRIFTPEVESLDLDVEQVKRFLGYQPGKTVITPGVEQALDEGIALARAAARPQAAVSYCAVDQVANGRVDLTIPGLGWQSTGLARLLRDARAVSLVGATIGDDIETAVRERFAAQDYAVATVVDAAGSVLIQALVAYVQAEIAQEAQQQSCGTTPIFCPGYADWDLQDQPRLVQLVNGDAIGLTCSPTCYLTPQKSLVGLIGWTAVGARLPASGCTACHLTTCSFRKVNE